MNLSLQFVVNYYSVSIKDFMITESVSQVVSPSWKTGYKYAHIVVASVR